MRAIMTGGCFREFSRAKKTSKQRGVKSVEKSERSFCFARFWPHALRERSIKEGVGGRGGDRVGAQWHRVDRSSL